MKDRTKSVIRIVGVLILGYVYGANSARQSFRDTPSMTVMREIEVDLINKFGKNSELPTSLSEFPEHLQKKARYYNISYDSEKKELRDESGALYRDPTFLNSLTWGLIGSERMFSRPGMIVNFDRS